MSEFDMSDQRPSRRGLLRGFAAATAAAVLPSMAAAAPLAGENPPRPLAPEIEQAVAAIEERLKAVPEGKTLFVPVGEHHWMASSSVFQSGLLSKLKERGHKVAYGAEFPYNVMRNAPLKPRRDRQFIRHMFNCDADGGVSLRYMLSESVVAEAVVAKALLTKTLLNTGISTRFHDLPGLGEDGYELDRRDPLLRKFSAAKRPISAVSHIGMEVRNLALVQGARDHAKDAGARIYVQHAGASHLFGGEQAPYRISLDAMFRRRGEAVLPLILDPDFVTPQAAAAVKTGQALIFDKMPNRLFYYVPVLNNPVAYKRLARQEVDYLHKMGETDARLPTPRDEKNFHQELVQLARHAKSCPEGSSLTVRLFGPKP